MEKIKTLYIDIEATDLDADIGHLLCIGYKIDGEKKAHVLDIRDYPGKTFDDDSQLLKAFEKIQSRAEIIVHHFGDFYDLPFLRTRRLIAGLKPLPEGVSVDTWRIARKKLKFKSNRLERILTVLGCPFKKTSLDINLWAKARWGSNKALDYIVHHCKMDILVLEWVYNRIKSSWPSHPTAYRAGDNGCKVCGKGKMLSNGIRPTQQKVYRRLVCSNCGFTDKGKVVN